MFPFDLLRGALAGAVDIRGEVPLVCAPIIRVIACDTKRLQQGFPLQKDVILTLAKNLRQALPGAMVHGVPEPPLFLLLANKTPHFIDFGLIHAADHDIDTCRLEGVQEGCVDRFERRPFFSRIAN